MPPGTLVHVGEKKLEAVDLTLMEYTSDRPVVERQAKTVTECLPLVEEAYVSWLNVDGIHQLEVISEIGAALDIHPLILEDILNTNQRPKVDEFADHLYIVLKMLYWDEVGRSIEMEQVSLILGKAYVVTFQESDRDVFDPVRKRIREARGRIRTLGADYLAYALIDAIVDHYFVILENLGEQIEFLEEELVTEPDVATLQVIHRLKREMIFMRKAVWPLREVIGRLERGESPLFQESSLIYLRDVYDHTIQVIDAVETFRDMVSGMLDIYLSSVSNKMNEVMKVLTIIATIFIPLTFIAGLYGMNFAYMPELELRWGYFAVLGLMAIIFIGMMVYFRRRKWL
jgi:magnesium transporter